MTEQYKPNIGEIPDGRAMRDAIHIAVAPVIAGEEIEPGDHVYLKNDMAYVTSSLDTKAIGVADPFLRGNSSIIREGSRFWLFLYQNGITSLRHVWQHPAFKARLPC